MKIPPKIPPHCPGLFSKPGSNLSPEKTTESGKSAENPLAIFNTPPLKTQSPLF
jgi:hypothetical protein